VSTLHDRALTWLDLAIANLRVNSPEDFDAAVHAKRCVEAYTGCPSGEGEVLNLVAGSSSLVDGEGLNPKEVMPSETEPVLMGGDRQASPEFVNAAAAPRKDVEGCELQPARDGWEGERDEECKRQQVRVHAPEVPLSSSHDHHSERQAGVESGQPPLSTLEPGREKCLHVNLHFGSGGFYVICSACQCFWVAKGDGNDTDIDYTRTGDGERGDAATLRRERDEARAQVGISERECDLKALLITSLEAEVKAKLATCYDAIRCYLSVNDRDCPHSEEWLRELVAARDRLRALHK